MKINRIKTTLFLSVLLIGFCTFALLNTRHIGRQMKKLVHKAQEVSITDVSDEDMAKSISPLIYDIKDSWEKYETILDTYSRHDEVERISECIDKLNPLYKTHRYTELNISLQQVSDALDHLVETETPTISNIL